MKTLNIFLVIVCTFAVELKFADSFTLFRHRRETNNTSIPIRCFQPPDSGMCLAYFQNYYYNSAEGKCQTFVYGGCGGNDNNFWSQQDCETVCERGAANAEGNENEFNLIIESLEPLVEGKDACEYPPETGECRALFNHYYFNGEKCETFVYGGCGGNPNNFETEEECIERCMPNSENESQENEV